LPMGLLVLLASYALFFVPVALRAGASDTPRRDLAALFAHPLRSPPGVLVQLVGGGLIVAGVAWAVASGTLPPAASARALLGSGVIVTGAALNGWALAHLRSWRFMPVLEADHQLCTTGPYAWVRHPIYAAIDLVGLGSLVWAPNPVVAAGVVCFVLGGDLRARDEERALTERFGDGYRDYAARVRRILPGVY
jgi:protein-S-isoprenylcysteine O-methyltransferase Ste14